MPTRLVLCVVLLAALGGCDSSSLPSIDMDWTKMSSPVARVQSVELVEQTDEGVRIEAVIELANANDRAIPLLVADYSVAIDGRDSFQFADTINRTIPANGKQTLRIAAAIATDGRPVTGANYRVQGKVRYMLPGEMPRIAVDSGIPPPAVDFAYAGRFQ